MGPVTMMTQPTMMYTQPMMRPANPFGSLSGAQVATYDQGVILCTMPQMLWSWYVKSWYGFPEQTVEIILFAVSLQSNPGDSDHAVLLRNVPEDMLLSDLMKFYFLSKSSSGSSVQKALEWLSCISTFRYRALLNKASMDALSERYRYAIHFDQSNQNDAYPAPIMPPSNLCSMPVCILTKKQTFLWSWPLWICASFFFFLLCLCGLLHTFSFSLN